MENMLLQCSFYSNSVLVFKISSLRIQITDHFYLLRKAFYSCHAAYEYMISFYLIRNSYILSIFIVNVLFIGFIGNTLLKYFKDNILNVKTYFTDFKHISYIDVL